MADALRLQRLCLDAKQWLAAASLPAAGDSEDPLRNCVLAYIGYWGCDRPSEPGVSRIDIGAALLNVAPVTATLAAVEWLRSEGYIYSTVDDYHFKTVDDCCMPGVPLDFARQRVPGMFGHLRPSPIAWPKSQFGPELDAAQTELHNAVLQWCRAAHLPAHLAIAPVQAAALAYMHFWTHSAVQHVGSAHRDSYYGVCQTDVVAALQHTATAAEILAAIKWLESEGLIYSTIDDAHFRELDDYTAVWPLIQLDVFTRCVPQWHRTFAAALPVPASAANPTQDLELAFQALAVLDLHWLPELPPDYSAPEHQYHLRGNPARVAVLRACRAGDDRGFGASIAGIAATMRGTVSSADMLQAVRDLVDLGYLYSTIDDDHLKATLG
eukprot:m.132372 g.132372  ORF g.132372 m.132372 type:complete len:382 (-) comp9486_c0_seq3:48-1193(-)